MQKFALRQTQLISCFSNLDGRVLRGWYSQRHKLIHNLFAMNSAGYLYNDISFNLKSAIQRFIWVLRTIIVNRFMSLTAPRPQKKLIIKKFGNIIGNIVLFCIYLKYAPFRIPYYFLELPQVFISLSQYLFKIFIVSGNRKILLLN